MQNDIFSIKRFLNYSIWNLRINWKTHLMLIGGLGIAFFIFSYLAILDDRNWYYGEWVPVVITSFIVGGLLFIASGFTQMRTKNGKLNFLLVPASDFEKFLFEWLVRFVGFVLIFYIITLVFGNAALKLAQLTKFIQRGRLYTGDPLQYKQLITQVVVTEGDREGVFPICAGIYFAFSLVFAGSVVFMKRALLKTILFVGGVMGMGGLYFYVLIEKFKIKEPFFIPYMKQHSDLEIFRWMGYAIVFFTLWILTYAFFKLKEKEV